MTLSYPQDFRGPLYPRSNANASDELTANIQGGQKTRGVGREIRTDRKQDVYQRKQHAAMSMTGGITVAIFNSKAYGEVVSASLTKERT